MWALLALSLADVIYRSIENEHEYEMLSASILVCGYVSG